jgi:hypothetical protein
MIPERIKVRMENGQTIDVVVLSKRAGGIQMGKVSQREDRRLPHGTAAMPEASWGGKLFTRGVASKCRRISTGSTQYCATPDCVDVNSRVNE